MSTVALNPTQQGVVGVVQLPGQDNQYYLVKSQAPITGQYLPVYSINPNSSLDPNSPVVPIPGYGVEEHPIRSPIPPVVPKEYIEKREDQTPKPKNQGYYIIDLIFWILEVAGLILILAYVIGCPPDNWYDFFNPTYPSYPIYPTDYPTDYPTPYPPFYSNNEERWTYFKIFYVGIAFLSLGVLGCVVRLWFSDTSRYLRNILREKSAYEYFNFINDSKPKVTMTMECYHYENFSRNAKTQRKETTLREAKEFNYDYSECLSGAVKGLEDLKFAKINIKQEIFFADEFTHQCFVEEENHFIERYRYTDRYFGYHRSFATPSFKNNVLVFSDPKSVPFYCSYLWFFLSHLVLLQYPYILFLRHISSEYSLDYRVTIQKRKV